MGFGEPEPSFFSLPRARLLTTGPWPGGGMAYGQRALSEGDCALCGERQTMLPCLRASVIIVCAEERRTIPPPVKTCHRQLFTALRGTGAERTNGGISI